MKHEINVVQFKEAFIDMLREKSTEQITEALVMRVNRIRAGKVQRQKKVIDHAAVKNFKMVGGMPERMSAEEMRHRALSQRIGAIKRKRTEARANKRRAISMLKHNRFFGTNQVATPQIKPVSDAMGEPK